MPQENDTGREYCDIDPLHIIDNLAYIGAEATADKIMALVTDCAQSLSVGEQVSLAVLLFAPEIWNALSHERQLVALETSLSVLAGADCSGWDHLDADEDFVRIANAIGATHASLPSAEQLTYAPEDSSWHQLGVSTIEQIGLIDPGGSREAERLLHQLGQKEAAYRIEQERKRKIRPSPKESGQRDETVPMQFRQIAIAGGHPKLTSAVIRAMSSSGAKIREIPSIHESVRRDRQIRAIVKSSDLIVIVVRQIAHATSDLVIQACRQYHVPFVPARTPSISGVLKAIQQTEYTKE